MRIRVFLLLRKIVCFSSTSAAETVKFLIFYTPTHDVFNILQIIMVHISNTSIQFLDYAFVVHFSASIHGWYKTVTINNRTCIYALHWLYQEAFVKHHRTANEIILQNVCVWVNGLRRIISNLYWHQLTRDTSHRK